MLTCFEIHLLNCSARTIAGQNKGCLSTESLLIKYLRIASAVRPICTMKLGQTHIFLIIYSVGLFCKKKLCQLIVDQHEARNKYKKTRVNWSLNYAPFRATKQTTNCLIPKVIFLVCADLLWNSHVELFCQNNSWSTSRSESSKCPMKEAKTSLEELLAK